MNQPLYRLPNMEQYINLLLDAFVTLLIPEKGKTAVHGCHGGQLPLPYLMIFFGTAIFFLKTAV